MSNQLFFKGAAAAALALALGACGDGGTAVGSGEAEGAGGGGGLASNAFLAAVNAVIASSSETLEPREIDSISVTSPEDSEPAALDS